MSKSLNRRDMLKAAGAAAAGAMLAPGLSFAQQDGGARPNILYIMSDDHAAQAISAYGSYRNITPNIDRIADEGMRFENCFCTNSICAPSRACVITGKYNSKNGVINNGVHFDGSQITFPKLLRDAGYQTAMIGKWHLKSPPTGFDYYNVLPGQGVYYNPDMIENGERKNYKGYVNEIITDHGLSWLKNRKDKKPFCLMLHHKSPHRNWQPGPDYLNKYDDKDIPEPPTLFDDYEGRCDAAKEQDMMIKKTLRMKQDLMVDWVPPQLDEEQKKDWVEAFEPENEAFKEANLEGDDLIRWKYQRYMKDYLRCIASVDEQVGRVLDYLDENGLTENTIVVYTSDQGFYLGEHGWFDKRWMYEESLRMPFLVRYPKEIKPGTVNDDIILNIDFAPTFLKYGGAPVPYDMQGESIRPLLRGRTPGDWRDAMYYHYYEYPAVHMVKRHYGIRTERYKLIHYYYDIDQWELFDLEKDPREMNSVYDDPEYADIVKDLKARLKKMRLKFGETNEVIKSFLPEKARDQVRLD